MEWNKYNWRNFTALQQPEWPSTHEYESILKELSGLPALVYAGETRALIKDLEEAVNGKAFILQCGDCSENFSSCNGPKIHTLVKIILQMSIILTYAGEKKVVNIGRIAGQYAKPRTQTKEVVNGVEIPVYRGDMVNSPIPTLEARNPNPNRILEGYFRSAATLNLVRAFTLGGYAALDLVDSWHKDLIKTFPLNKKFDLLVKGIRKAINFTNAIGLDINSPQLNQITLYTSHEALLLGYEEAMTRIDTTTNDWYDTSAHMLWIGDRTRQIDGAHVEFLRGVGNPVGVKIGPDYELDEIKKVIACLNPYNISGKISLITRFGVKQVDSLLPPLIREIKKEGFKIVWICDPMHGNTYKSNNFKKTRKFKDILEEIRKHFQIADSEGIISGGVHLELTGENVTECTGGSKNINDSDLNINYLTHCDPRLNAEQSVELAFEIAEILKPKFINKNNIF